MTLEAGVILSCVLAWSVVWAVLGRAAWWVPAFAFSFLGGQISVGFKVYPHEIGMGLGLIALAPLVVANPRPLPGRPRLDWSFYLLVAYMLGHLAVSSHLAAGLPGRGTIVRHYFSGLWALVFAVLFWAYGDLRRFRTALVLATAFCVVRVSLDVLAVYSPEAVAVQTTGPLFLPGRAVLMEWDLRTSAPALMGLLTIWFYQGTRKAARAAIVIAYASAIWLTLLGASRVAALTVFVIPVIWALVQRHRLGLVAHVVAVATLLISVNYSADVYQRTPEPARRSLSKFVAAPTATVATAAAPAAAVGTASAATTIEAETESSDAWHFGLLKMGFRRWTTDAVSVTFGNRIEGWREEYATLTSVPKLADIAARLGSYENALCTVTTTLGVVGLLLFMRVGYWLYRPLVRHILRDRIRNPDDALVFVAVQSLIVFVGLCWIAGGYPSSLIVVGTLGAVALSDRKSR